MKIVIVKSNRFVSGVLRKVFKIPKWNRYPERT